jgi:hypothetical protein
LDSTLSVKAPLSPDDLARACAEAMWKDDDASQGLGMEILDVKAGQATLAMTVKPHMVNGHGIAHGGFIFLLADSTFAFACNSHNAPLPRNAIFRSSSRASSATGSLQRQRKSSGRDVPGFTTCALRSMVVRSPNCAAIPAPSAARGYRLPNNKR